MSEPLVPVPRRVRPWQPNPALLLVSTARAFAAAHWEDVRQHGSVQTAAMADDVLEADEDSASARPFTDDGLVRPHDGFEPLKIRPFNEPLSELSRQALQRFNAEQAAAHPLGEEPLHLEAHAAGDHAPAARA